MEACRHADQASPVEGVDAGISAWAAEDCSGVPGQELRREGGQLRGGLASDAKAREFRARKKFKVLKPVKGGTLFK